MKWKWSNTGTRRRHAARRTALVTAFAVTGVTVAAAPAAATEGDVLAYGRNVDGVCLFEPVPLPREVAVRADEACRLIVDSVRPATEAILALGPPASRVPKRLGDASSPSGVPGPGVSTDVVSDGLDVVDDAAAIAAKQAGATTYRVDARWPFFNERGQLMYDDHFSVVFRRYAHDGSIFGATVGDAAYCGTGAGVFPHQPVADPADCTWAQGYWSGYALSFATNGSYADYLGLAPWDSRSLSMAYYTQSDGKGSIVDHESCSPLDALPVGWSTPGCRIEAAPL